MSRQKINFPANQKGYDNSKTTVGRLSAKRIQIFRVQFCLDVVWKVILKRGEMDDTKLNLVDVNSPSQELSNGGLRVVVALLVCWKIIFLSAQTLTLYPAVVYLQ